MKDYGLYKTYTTSTTTTVRLYHRGDKRNEHVELDDTAPLPLFIGIGLALFIGFVLLILICCLCRRRPTPPSTTLPDRQVNSSHYQRAPMNDGIGVGVSYPLASVPPASYFNSTVTYAPPHMGHPIQHNYGVIGSGVSYGSAAHSHYPQQPPHFGGVPTYPPNQYIPSHTHTPHSTPHLSHSPSHSSQTSSSVSRTTADPLVPSASLSQQQQQQQQIHHPHLQFQHQQHVPPGSALQQHHQYIQQQFLSGRQSPAVHFSQIPYSTILVNEHTPAPLPNTVATTPAMTSAHVNHPLVNNQSPGMVHSPSYTNKDEDE